MELNALYVPHTKPFPHQAEVFEETKDEKTYALFWEQGVGKTKITIDTFSHQYINGDIDCVIVVAPNGVHRNWVTDELPTHASPAIPLRAYAYSSAKAGTKRQEQELDALLKHNGLSFLAISYDAWVTEKGKKYVWKLMKKRRVFLVLDESHRIKTPNAKRTRSILLGGKYAVSRRILSGTPVTNGPFDIYSQMLFLDAEFWKNKLDIASFSAFKSYFGVWDKGYNRAQDREFEVLLDYRNLDELSEAVKGASSRVTKKQALDLPEKLYTKRYYEMSPAQKRVYEALEQEFSVWLEDGNLVTAQLAITRMLRLQQVLCGYIPADGDEEPTELIDRKNNPRINVLREAIEDIQGKAIVWATWTRDIDMIMEELKAAGRNPVRYDGTLSDEQREESKRRFKHGDATDFVANSQMSEGLTLTEANTVIYYNNSYKLIDRMQSEDRAHRIGQKHPVLYVDLVCPGTRDENAIEALVAKLDVASTILGDEKKEWL
jgi:SNF2 family DNA or RNA helicase